MHENNPPANRPGELKRTAREVPPAGLGDDVFHGALETLLGQLDSLPPAERERLRGAADATRRRHEQLKETVGRLQETLDYLRLNIKYLIFDVEATKRENTYLRKMLDEANGSE